MQKVYTRINWENVPSEATPINETNLNRMDYALNEIDGRVVAFDTSKAEQSDLLQTLKTVSYDSATGVFTFTLWNGTTITADLNIEKIPVSFAMDANGIITMTTSDGSTYTADVGSLIKTYTFNDSTDIDFNVVTDSSGNKTVTATIVDGSVTASKLQPNYLADIQTEVASAQAYANSASGSATTAGNQALEAEAWADGQKNGVDVPSTAEQYHNNAKYWAEQAQQAGSSGHTIVDENGTSYSQEPNLQFVGAKVSDDSTNNKTVITVWEHKTKAQWEAMTPQERADGNFIVSGLGATGDLKNNYVSFTSGDSADADATSWTSVQPMANTDIFSTLFNKISTMAKNVRYLKNLLNDNVWEDVTSEFTFNSGIRARSVTYNKFTKQIRIFVVGTGIASASQWIGIPSKYAPDTTKLGLYSGMYYFNANLVGRFTQTASQASTIYTFSATPTYDTQNSAIVVNYPLSQTGYSMAMNMDYIVE